MVREEKCEARKTDDFLFSETKVAYYVLAEKRRERAFAHAHILYISIIFS